MIGRILSLFGLWPFGIGRPPPAVNATTVQVAAASDSMALVAAAFDSLVITAAASDTTVAPKGIPS